MARLFRTEIHGYGEQQLIPEKRKLEKRFSFRRAEAPTTRVMNVCGVKEIRRALPGIRFEIRTKWMSDEWRRTEPLLPSPPIIAMGSRDSLICPLRYTHKITYIDISSSFKNLPYIHHLSTNNRDELPKL